MKNTFLALFAMLFGAVSFGQVAFTIFEPASIAGGYEFTSNGDALNWGLPNLNDPADAVTASIVISDDGTPGINAQGVPHANEGCSTIINDLTGKIALIYRYDGASDNACYGGTKVLNAQNAGAIGVIMVNRDNSVYGYNGTTDGPSTTIPFAFITKDDGALIREKIEAGEDVVAFIGNKLNLFDDDAGIVNKNTIAPSFSAVASQTAASETEFGFDLGTTIYNYGGNTQSNIMISATVTGPIDTWTETRGPFELESGDSVNVFTGGTNDFPRFSSDSYPVGTYTLDYNVDLGVADESIFDNDMSYQFVVSDDMVSYCKIDEETGLPSSNRFSRSGTSSFNACMVYENSNANRIGAKGMHFVAESTWNLDLLLEGEEVGVVLYKWQDEFVDIEDVGFGFEELDIITEAIYVFGEGSNAEFVYAPFDTPVLLENDQRYLACIQVLNPDIWIGFSTEVDYTRNIATNSQPLFPISSDGDYFGLGFGEEMVPSIALSVFDAAELSIKETKDNASFNLYPNPTNATLNVVFKKETMQVERLRITDLSGRIIRTITNVNMVNSIDISDLADGQYVLVSESENGTSNYKKFLKF